MSQPDTTSPPPLASGAAAAQAQADAEASARQKADEAAERAEAQRRDRLLRLMQKIDAQPDFASMKESMAGIQKVSRSERAHVLALTNLIHDDTAMVSKLLRLINAAFYSSVGGGNITSLQRAVALMGFKSVALLASSLLIFERLPKGVDGDKLRREFARAQLAALLAHDFCHSRTHIEHAYIAALFQRLGEMLAGLHLSEDMQIFEDQLDDEELAAGSAERAAARVQPHEV
jgi:HD-like signal output (HDOD) protein